MSAPGPSLPGAEYRIEGLAHASGASVRTIRAYQDRGLLPRPERRGRANVYDGTHLARLRLIAELLGRGYTLASIKELLEARDSGRGLGWVLGPAAGAQESWTDGEPGRISRTEPAERFGGIGHSTSRSPDSETRSVTLPADTIRAIQGLVGPENVAAFITAAAERELRARTLDALASINRQHSRIDQIG
ncbi:MerR family transcriptional regulator [Streptomyces odonnellii]|uniref:MerR family transcriptional regulator n=1 Tax=Streptomyces odonnellii TaxID=1417980 RepID=UPI0006258E01|nr:MerR family transcriptional regulator [Streptomyces odonnellii]